MHFLIHSPVSGNIQSQEERLRKEEGSAEFFPARSNAVPWSGKCGRGLRPAVKLTPFPPERALNDEPLIGGLAYRLNGVELSAFSEPKSHQQEGTITSIPFLQFDTVYRMKASSSLPSTPSSPACGLRPSTAIEYCSSPEVHLQRMVHQLKFRMISSLVRVSSLRGVGDGWYYQADAQAVIDHEHEALPILQLF